MPTKEASTGRQFPPRGTEMPELRRPDHLPDFSAPPVQEVVIGIHFNPIYGLHQAHIGSFWERIREDYPRVQDHETLPRQVTYPDMRPVLDLTLSSTLPPLRAWLLSEDSTALVQLQHDRIVHNWRNRGAPYLHFEAHLTKFCQVYENLIKALDNFQLPEPQTTHIEVAYINSIEAPSLSTALPQFPRILLSQTRGVGPHTVQERMAIRFPVFNDKGEIGSLNVEATPVISDPITSLRLAFVFHGRIQTNDLNRVVPLILRGREAIVEAFTELTSEELHQEWRRIK